MAVTVTNVSPLTPVQKVLERPAPTLPLQTNDEGGNSGAVAGIPNNNGKVPDNFYGVASPGAGTGVKPTAVNATQGPVAQDDFATLAAASYSSTSFTPPDPEAALQTFAGQVTGVNAGIIPAYASGTTYALGDRVAGTTAGTAPFYQSLVAGNIGHTPASSPTKWQPIGTTAVTQGPAGAWGYAFANPALLPLWTSAAVVKGSVVGYISVNATYEVAGKYASGTTYAAGAFVIGTDNLVYISLQAGNVGNDPTLAASQGVFWDMTLTTWSAASNYVVGKQVLKDGVLYVCVSAVTSNEPDQDSTDWGSGVTVAAWASGTTFASGNIVEYNDSIYISLKSSNTDQIPGTQTGTTTGVSWWAKLAVAPWDDSVNYLAGQYVTFTAPTTGITTLYLAQSGKNPVAQNPRINNQLQIDSDSTQDNLPATVLWNAVGYGVVAPFIAIAASTNVLPDANNQLVGTAGSWQYLVAGNNVASIAGDSQLARAQISYPPLTYAEGTEFTDWQMGSYFGPAAQDSPTQRTDFSTIVAKIVLNLPASFAHTTTAYGTVTVTDNNGFLLTPGQRGVGALVVVSGTPATATVSAVEDGTFLITGVAAGTTVITASIGNTRSASGTLTLS